MGRGVQVRLRYINEYRDRHGKLRRYFRRAGFKRVPIPGMPGSREFIESYHAALAGQSERRPIGANRNAPGSVASAVSLYFASAAFAVLAPDTRRSRRNELERFRVAHGEKRLALMERRHVEQHIRDKSPVSARNCLKALSPWLQWCVGERLIPSDPSSGIKRPVPGNKEGYKTWNEEYVEHYRARHPIGSKARLAFELLVNVGSARVDTALLGRQHVRDGMLCYRRHKTNVLVEIPVLPDLQRIIDEMAATERLTFVATDQGTAYTKESFGNYFREWCRQADIPRGYSAHGVRKYAAKVRADLGATAHELMAWFGWLTIREAERYTRDAARRKLAMSMARKLTT